MSGTITEQFRYYHDSPASRIRYEQAKCNLKALHDLGQPLRVLDAAGGNGLITEWLLRQGHRVTLLDADSNMLDDARQRLNRHKLLDDCELVLGNLENVSQYFPASSFDLIICHHALEYTPLAPDVLAGLGALAGPSGELSLITLNPVSEVIRAIVFRRDLELAKMKLHDLSYDAKWFGQATLYSIDTIVGWCEAAGWRFRDYRAIRVLVDYLSESLDEANVEAALRLEKELTGKEPYRRFGRYIQFCFRK